MARRSELDEDRPLILVDSSVSVDYFRGTVTRQTDKLMHSDRDFDPFAAHLGLRVVE